jgi:hypothetical protein
VLVAFVDLWVVTTHSRSLCGSFFLVHAGCDGSASLRAGVGASTSAIQFSTKRPSPTPYDDDFPLLVCWTQ